VEMRRCPRCHGGAVGRVGLAQWYCWDCCVEFTTTSRGVEVFTMDEEGELRPLPVTDRPWQPEVGTP
jgi:hypothetical protein